jgi:pimeloyl-ACP methyl ester carboxylesterase
METQVNVEHHSLHRNGLNWHVVTAGPPDAPPVLLLHCWAGNWTLWQTTLQRLSVKYRCIAPDLLGFGQSDKPRGDHYQIPAQTERTRFILNHFGCDRAHVLGHSMGGQIALTFAAHDPDRVDRLIVVDPAVTGQLHLLAQPLLLFPTLARRGIEFPYRWTNKLGHRFPSMGSQLMRPFFPYPKRQREAALYWLGQMGADGQLDSSAWAVKAIMEWDVRTLLEGVTAQTLAIWGMKDWLVPVQQCSLLEQTITNCRSVRIPDVGHFPMIEAFEIYMKEIESFLE